MSGLRKHEPVPEDEMKKISPKYSICETLREIYFSTDDPEIKLRCRIATSMAKSMTNKLIEYTQNSGWFANYWDDNEDLSNKLSDRLGKTVTIYDSKGNVL